MVKSQAFFFSRAFHERHLQVSSICKKAVLSSIKESKEPDFLAAPTIGTPTLHEWPGISTLAARNEVLWLPLGGFPTLS
jgi:hypothetical protein